jgi:hypothetical protein
LLAGQLLEEDLHGESTTINSIRQKLSDFSHYLEQNFDQESWRVWASKQSQETRDSTKRKVHLSFGAVAISTSSTMFQAGCVALTGSGFSPVLSAAQVLGMLVSTCAYKINSAAIAGVKQAEQDKLSDSDLVEDDQEEKLERFLNQTINEAEKAYNDKSEAGETSVNKSV